MFTVNAASGFGTGVNIIPDASLSYTAHAESTADATTYTFSSVALGTEAGNRTMIIGCTTFGPGVSNCIITSATLGGSALTIEAHQNDSTLRNNIMRIENIV